MNTHPHNRSPKEITVLSDNLSKWAESNEFFEALHTTTVLPRTPKGSERIEKTISTATRGRPALAAAVQGESPTINARVTPNIKARLTHYAQQHGVKPSDVIRDALDSYLPQNV